jgi:hypothetical protein
MVKDSGATARFGILNYWINKDIIVRNKGSWRKRTGIEPAGDVSPHPPPDLKSGPGTSRRNASVDGGYPWRDCVDSTTFESWAALDGSSSKSDQTYWLVSQCAL